MEKVILIPWTILSPATTATTTLKSLHICHNFLLQQCSTQSRKQQQQQRLLMTMHLSGSCLSSSEGSFLTTTIISPSITIPQATSSRARARRHLRHRKTLMIHLSLEIWTPTQYTVLNFSIASTTWMQEAIRRCRKGKGVFSRPSSGS